MAAPAAVRPRTRIAGYQSTLEAAALVLVPLAISCLMLWPALLNQGVFAPADIVAYQPLMSGRPPGSQVFGIRNPYLSDVIDTFIPWKMLAREQLAGGRFPLWNPYNALGTHFLANLQSQVLSPFNLLWLALPALWGLGAVTALKWTLAGLGMGMLLRRLGLGLGPALFGAVAFQLSGPMVAWLQWPLSEGYAWVPWMMWAALGWVDTLGPVWLAALSAFVAAELLAGHVETSFHSAIFLGLFALAAWAARPYEGRRSLVALGGLLGAAVLGLVISAAQLLPFLAVLPNSHQWWLRAQASPTGLSLPSSAALLWLTPNGFGWPDAYHGPSNPIEAAPYVGALTILLAVTGVGLVRWSRPRWSARALVASFSPRQPLFWWVMLAISASMAYGIPPLSLLRELPGFSSSLNWRLISISGFCLAVLAAMALDRLVNWRGKALHRLWFVPLVALLLAAAGFLASGWRAWIIDSIPAGPYQGAWRAWAGALFCFGAALLLARLLRLVPGRVLAAICVVLLTAEMARATWDFNPVLPAKTFYPSNDLLQFAAKRGPTQRTAVVGEFAAANTLVPYRFPEYSVYDATVDNRYYDYTRLLSPDSFRRAFATGNGALTDHLMLLHPSAALLSTVGIRWVLTASADDPNTWQPPAARGPAFRKVMDSNGFSIWENRYATPFAYLAGKFHVITPDENPDVPAAALTRMRTISLDTVNVVQIEDPDRTFPSDVGAENRGSPLVEGEGAILQSYAPGEIAVGTRTQRPRFLVINEGSAPGWYADVDGRPVPIYRSEYLVQGVVVPAGEHTVRLVYSPPAFRWGVRLSVAGLAAWFGLLVLAFLRRRKARS